MLLRRWRWVLFLLFVASLQLGLGETPPDPDENETGENCKACKTKGQLDKLHSKWQGIWWYEADTTCTPEQFEILVRTVEVSYWHILRSVAELSDDERYDTSSFSRFFFSGKGYDYPIHWKHPALDAYPVVAERYQWLVTTLNSVWKFPLFGKSPELLQKSRITLRCEEIGGLSKCRQSAAYTAHPIVAGKSWTIVFCAPFWKYRYIEELAKKEGRGVEDLKGTALVSYEHLFIHELFHVGMASAAPKYDDTAYLQIKDKEYWDARINNCDKTYAYGSANCWFYARMNDHKVGNSILPNLESPYNADNYAWFYTNWYFAKHYGWTDNGTKVLGLVIDWPRDPIDDPLCKDKGSRGMDIDKDWTHADEWDHHELKPLVVNDTASIPSSEFLPTNFTALDLERNITHEA